MISAAVFVSVQNQMRGSNFMSVQEMCNSAQDLEDISTGCFLGVWAGSLANISTEEIIKTSSKIWFLALNWINGAHSTFFKDEEDGHRDPNAAKGAQ